MQIAPGTRVKIYDFEDTFSGVIGVVLATNVTKVPHPGVPGGFYEFAIPRYVVQLEEVFQDRTIKVHPQAGSLSYPAMDDQVRPI